MRLLSSRACATGHRGSVWRLAHCKSRQDERAQERLIRQGFDCYWPPLRRERLLRGRRQTVGESLIPGYLFAHLHPNRSWSPLRSTHSVNRLASFGSYPLEIPQTFVDTLQQRTQPEPQPLLQPGDRVRIVEGSFARAGSHFPVHGWRGTRGAAGESAQPGTEIDPASVQRAQGLESRLFGMASDPSPPARRGRGRGELSLVPY